MVPVRPNPFTAGVLAYTSSARSAIEENCFRADETFSITDRVAVPKMNLTILIKAETCLFVT